MRDDEYDKFSNEYGINKYGKYGWKIHNILVKIDRLIIKFTKRCQLCNSKVDGQHVLAISINHEVHVCKKCFYSSDVWERYYNIKT